MLDHFVVLLRNQVPPNRPREHAGEVGQQSGHPCRRHVEAFILDPLQAGHQSHATEQVTKRESHFGLTVRIHEVLLNSHSGVVADQAFDHRRDSEAEKFRSCE